MTGPSPVLYTAYLADLNGREIYPRHTGHHKAQQSNLDAPDLISLFIPVFRLALCFTFLPSTSHRGRRRGFHRNDTQLDEVRSRRRPRDGMFLAPAKTSGSAFLFLSGCFSPLCLFLLA